MATKRINLFLYLALACFLSIVIIFIADGYLGTYDTVYITAGEREEKVEPDFWLREDRTWSSGVDWGEKVKFKYEVDNRWFRTYSAEVAVSVWHSQEKVQDLVAQDIQVAPFDKERLEWVVDTEELMPAEITPEQAYNYTLIIKRGEVERKVVLYVNPSYPPKVPLPVR